MCIYLDYLFQIEVKYLIYLLLTAFKLKFFDSLNNLGFNIRFKYK